MDKRELFPKVMFVVAGISFAFGIFEYFQASALQSAEQARLAFIMTSIERSPLGAIQKKDLYATISHGLPSTPGLFTIDFSGSFASTGDKDFCASDGQRSICRALKANSAGTDVISNVCGACNPQ